MKRSIDLVGALVILLALLPLVIVLAALVSIDRGPVFFCHRRIGRGGTEFPCIKFRSMRPNASKMLDQYLSANPEAAREWATTRKLSHDPRITPLGRILRISSLDEIPQLFNVIRGDMSLVGPRPVTREELQSMYGDFSSYYTLVRPGITGLWQVSGRSGTTYEQRIALDVAYVQNPSTRQDLKILLRTVPAVLGRKGAG